MYDLQMKKIRAARIDLLAKHAFFADLAFGLPIEFSEQVLSNGKPTAGTDGEKIYFHPLAVDEWSVLEMVFIVAHEVMHPALFHNTRRGPRDPGLWNVACDIVVNHHLVKANVGKMPKGGIVREDLYLAGNGKAEAIYELLVQENKDNEGNGKPQYGGEPGAGDGVSSLDIVMDANPEKQVQQEVKWKAKLAQAMITAKMAGKMPAGLEETIEEALEPKVEWTKILRQFLLTTKGEERTWSRPNRRYQSSDIYLPGSYGFKSGEVVVLVDCSGSVSNQMIEQAAAEIISIHSEIRPEMLHVMYFDTEVKKHDTYEPEDTDIEIKAYGRGGTCFRTSFEYIEAQGIDPMHVVVLTDLYDDDYGPPPPYPVLWVAPKNAHGADAPWGQTLITN